MIARRFAVAIGMLGVAAMLLGVGPVLAADPVAFGEPTASSTFGKSVEFEQPVTLGVTPARVDLLISTPGAIGPDVMPLADPVSSGSSTLRYSLDLSNGQTVPNTTFTTRWRVVDAGGKSWLGPAVQQTYVDDRFDWKTLTGLLVSVHWYKGDQAFGAKALKIGEDAVAATSKLLGVAESDPIDFFIYADQKPFYDALGPGTRENVGGQARPDIRTLFALIAPDEIDAGWIESVVPHELTHVVFATATDNPYHEPPHWLNEGLAVYLSDGYDAAYKATVEGAAKDGSIMPLDGLAGAFPTTRDRFFLAYGESVSAVDRIVRVDGREALVKLIRSYHDGVSDDEAFDAALGRDLAGFESDWLTDLGASEPVRRGPQPAPGGPVPSGWAGPQPNPSFDVIGSGRPAANAPGPIDKDSGSGTTLVAAIVAVMLLGLLLVAGVVIVGRRRRATAVRRSFHPVAAMVPPTTWTTTDWSLPRDDEAAAKSSAVPTEQPGEAPSETPGYTLSDEPVDSRPDAPRESPPTA
jgi:hypothetical protein